MGDQTSPRGLSDVRTALTSRLHSLPTQKGTGHRDLYLLSKEKERLEKEIALIDRRRKRVTDHLAETTQIIAKLLEEAQPESQGPEGASAPATGDGRAPARETPPGQWKTMTLEY